MRNDGFSPQKDVRRSTRERSTVYTTLHENNLGLNNGLIDQLIHKANQQHERELNERHSHQPGFTRSGRKIHSYYKGDDSTDDDVPIQRPSTRSRVYRDGVYEAIEESRKMHARELEQKKSKTDPPLKRRHVIDVEADSDGEMEDDPDVRNYSTSIYDHVKGERRLSSIENQATNDRSSPLPQSPNSSRRVRFARKARGADDEEKHCDIADLIREQPNVPLNGTSAGQAALKVKEKSDEEDEEDDEEVQEPRQYSLRVRRPPIQQPSQEMHRARYRDHSRESRRRRDDRSSRRSSSRNHPRRRRIVRSDSDSTGDEELFERRKERSMAKHRSRFMPINMTEKDLLNMESTLIKDRLRQTGGASCSDIDPMSIDQTLGFDQIGGLGQHIQSLKEVVIFPMLYPDVFSNFNIAPPKGVIFYGPPGTGKTMLARAIANECAQGVSKVAFFMRKGADCLSKWVGESERQLRLLFDQAYSMRPSIIFFDEIDGLAPVRSSKQDQIHASIVSTLLALMDGLDNRGDVVVIGATNRLDTLDPALRRPGRFDRELRFSLPDRNSRRQILDIHTSKWNENKPDEETLDWISGATSGYCGADIKQLCTESVLIALRSRYPQIYMTSERLALDVSSIKISKQHFETALQRITPASRRDLTIPSRPLDARTTIILGDVIEDLIVTRVPQGYQNTMALEAIASSVLEKVVRILEKPPVVPAVRLLLCGTEANANLGQTSFVLPAMLGRLDHLPVFSLSLSCLLKDSRPEEAISNVIISATRAASSGPCILLIPSIVEWEQIVPVSVVHLLTTFLDSLTGFTPILLLATLETSYEHSSEFVKSVFRPADCARFTPPHRSTRIRYFQHVLDNSLQLPSVFDASNYVMLPKASASEAAVVKRKLAENEVQGLKKMFSSLLRQLRIFLRDKLNRLIRDRRFSDFLMPVAIGDAADYYEIIENPMCLTDMMEKIDKREYNHADQFLDDIRLITMNALEYNPAITQDGRAIRHMAVGLRDVTEELFESELDESFIENLEAVSRLLQEAGVTPDDEKLIDMPAGFVRKSQWSITNSLKNEIAKWAKTRSKETAVASGTPTSSTLVQEPPKKAKKRRMGANGCSSRKRRLSKQIRDRNQTPEYLEDKGDEEEKDTDVIMNGMESDGIATDEDSNSVPLDEANGDKRVLMISQTDVAQLVDFCAETTEGWSVDDLERLAAEMLHQIEKFCDTWDRRSLLGDLEMVVKKWAMTSHAHS